MKADIRIVHNALEKRDFLVGNNVTIADIAMFGHFYVAMQTILDPGFRKSVQNFERWFLAIAARPEVRRRLGNVKPCQRAMKPILAEAPK